MSHLYEQHEISNFYVYYSALYASKYMYYSVECMTFK